MIDTKKINDIVESFIVARDWNQFHSIKNLTMALNVETSELLEIFQWMREEESNLVPANPKLKVKVEDEIADIFIYLLRISIKSGIDIENAVLSKIKKNEEKYPVDKAKGSAKKYDEF